MNRNAWQNPQLLIYASALVQRKKKFCRMHIVQKAVFLIAFFHPPFSDVLNFVIKLKPAFRNSVYILFAASEKQVFSSQSEYFEQIPALKCK